MVVLLYPLNFTIYFLKQPGEKESLKYVLVTSLFVNENIYFSQNILKYFSQMNSLYNRITRILVYYKIYTLIPAEFYFVFIQYLYGYFFFFQIYFIFKEIFYRNISLIIFI